MLVCNICDNFTIIIYKWIKKYVKKMKLSKYLVYLIFCYFVKIK